MQDHIVLRRDHVEAVLDLGASSPVVVHLGDPIGEPIDAFLAARDWPVPEAGTDTLAPLALVPEAALGFPVTPGVRGARADGSGAFPRFLRQSIDADEHRVSVVSLDAAAELELHTELRLAPGGVLQARAELTNRASEPYGLDGLELTVALPAWGRQVVRFGGRWSSEFRAERVAFDNGRLDVENRAGRTSHDRFPALFVGNPGFADTHGRVWGAHVGWSGNTVVRAEVLSDGRRVLQGGELLLPGEIRLARGESYTTPWLHLATSTSGLNGVSDRFHTMLRARPRHPQRPRPVTLNTWEAVYFDHDLERLLALVDCAGDLGVERFVLDDGWFRHRRNDRAGLGDWFVDETVWPQGLHPLVQRVVERDMEFGLWFEPEMVNPDSDLLRSHPDWALVDDTGEPVLARNQLVLDLTRTEAYEHILERLRAMLDEYPIAYVKWDMNRNLVAPVSAGRATVHRQVEAVYRMLDALRASHPDLEIESCSSGGGRSDFAILARTDRVWTSDCNDALDRQAIQRGASLLIPPELMGAHVGPPRAHTTGRTHSLAFRAATAFFGHFGIEWNVLDATDADRHALRHVIAEHKARRPLLHRGRVVRLDHPDPAIVAHGVVAPDRRHALFCVAQVATSAALATGPIEICGLDSALRYRVSELALAPRRGGKAKRQPEWLRSGIELTGAQLAAGLQLPILDPEDAIVIEVEGIG